MLHKRPTGRRLTLTLSEEEALFLDYLRDRKGIRPSKAVHNAIQLLQKELGEEMRSKAEVLHVFKEEIPPPEWGI